MLDEPDVGVEALGQQGHDAGALLVFRGKDKAKTCDRRPTDVIGYVTEGWESRGREEEVRCFTGKMFDTSDSVT